MGKTDGALRGCIVGHAVHGAAFTALDYMKRFGLELHMCKYDEDVVYTSIGS